MLVLLEARQSASTQDKMAMVEQLWSQQYCSPGKHGTYLVDMQPSMCLKRVESTGKAPRQTPHVRTSVYSLTPDSDGLSLTSLLA